MATYGDQDIQCPFYRSSDAKGRISILCEGLFSETVRHQFLGYKELEDHRERYCKTMLYGLCPYAKAMEEKYEYKHPKA